MASILDLLPLVLKSLPAYQTQKNGKDLSQQTAIASQINNLSDAQINPDNPLFQKLYSQNKEAGQQNLASTIAELQNQNRKALTLGRGPLLDQERGGESIFRNLIQGQQGIGEQARTGTLAQLRQGQQSLQGSYSNYNDLSNNQYANQVSKANASGTMADALQSLFGLKRSTNGGLPNNQITWNGPRVGMLE